MNHEFRIVCACIAGAIVVVRGYFYAHTKAFNGAPSHIEGWGLGLLRRLFLGLGVMVSLGYLLGVSWLNHFTGAFTNSIRWGGVFIMALSPGIFAWVHLALGYNFSRTLILQCHHTLVTTGPYRLVRHPMYSAFALMYLGLFLASNNYLIGCVGLFYMTVIMIRIAKEENMLLEYFHEEYTQYMARTGRLVPKLSTLNERWHL